MTRSSPISSVRVEKKLTRSLWQKHVFGVVLNSAEWAGSPAVWVEWKEVGLRGVRLVQLFRPPNGSILLKCEACTFLTRYNKSINCVWRCACVWYTCVCAHHAWRGNRCHLNRKYPLPFGTIDVTVTAHSSAHHNPGWHMLYNENAWYRRRSIIRSLGHTCMQTHMHMHIPRS